MIGSRLDGDWNHPQLEQLLLRSLAANTSSPLPGSFAPQNLFKRARHSTSSNTLFTLSLPLQHFFPPLLLPTHSFLLSKDTPRAHPNQASPCRLLSFPNDASTNPQPQSLPCSPLSCLRSNWSLAFCPLLSGETLHETLKNPQETHMNV